MLLRDYDPEQYEDMRASALAIDDEQRGSAAERRDTDRAYGISPAERFDLDRDARRLRDLTLLTHDRLHAQRIDADQAADDERGFE